MGEQISKKDANPIVVAILNFLLGGVGYFMIGQKSKGIWGTVIFIIIFSICWVLGFILCWILVGFIFWLLPFIWSIITAIDGHKVATKLAAGESLDICHCELAFLAKLPGFHE
jgi:protein-S-isoprenylcysteine O-methyltransferase Ste14